MKPFSSGCTGQFVEAAKKVGVHTYQVHDLAAKRLDIHISDVAEIAYQLAARELEAVWEEVMEDFKVWGSTVSPAGRELMWERFWSAVQIEGANI